MLFPNRLKFYNKNGYNYNFIPDYAIQIEILDGGNTGYGAVLRAHVDRVSKKVSNIEIIEPGQNYNNITTYLKINDLYNGQTFIIPNSNITWDINDGFSSISLIIPNPNDNTGFTYPNEVWKGEIYFPNISTNLIETQHLFILEEVKDQFGNIHQVFPRINLYPDVTPDFIEIKSGSINLFFSTPFTSPFYKDNQVYLKNYFSFGIPDGIYNIDSVSQNKQRITIKIENITDASYQPNPVFGIIKCIPKIKCELVGEENEIFLYTVDYSSLNSTEPLIIKTNVQYLNFEYADFDFPNDILPVGNGDAQIRTVNTAHLRKNACAVNIGISGDTEGVYLNSLRITEITDINNPVLLSECIIRGEIEGEDERFSFMLDNFGMKIGKNEEFLFRDSDIHESLPNQILLNKKKKELLLEFENIFPYIASYKGIVNLLNWFGYPDLRIKEYWKNINTESPDYGKWIQEQIPFQLKNKKLRNQFINLLPNSNFEKTNVFGLFYDLNKVTEETDEFGIPIVKDSFQFSIDEILIKLFGLKRFLESKFLPLNTKIIDISGEGVYFSRYSMDTWNNHNNSFKINLNKKIGFSVVQNHIPVINLKNFNPLHYIDFLNYNSEISEFYDSYNILDVNLKNDLNSFYGLNTIPKILFENSVSGQNFITKCSVKAQLQNPTLNIPWIYTLITPVGTGYVANDLIILKGGVYETPIKIRITAVDINGAVISFAIDPGISQGAQYTTLPNIFYQSVVYTDIGGDYVLSHTGTGFWVASNALWWTIDTIQLVQRGTGYKNNNPQIYIDYSGIQLEPGDTYSNISPFISINAPELTTISKKVKNGYLIANFNNPFNHIDKVDNTNGPIGALLDLKIDEFKLKLSEIGGNIGTSFGNYKPAILEPIMSVPVYGSSSVIGINIIDPGFGYKYTPKIAIEGGEGFGCICDCTVQNGIITNVTVIDPGFGYTSIPTVHTEGGFGSYANTVGTIARGGYFEGEWTITLTSNNPDGKEGWRYVYRDTVDALMESRIILPYQGTYSIELKLWRTDGSFSVTYKKNIVTVYLPELDIIHAKKYNKTPRKISELKGKVKDYKSSIFYPNTSNLRMKVKDAKIKIKNLRVHYNSEINEQLYPLPTTAEVIKVYPQSFHEGNIIEINLNNGFTDLIILDKQWIHPPLEPNDIVYLKDGNIIIPIELFNVYYNHPNYPNNTVLEIAHKQNTATFVYESILPKGLSLTWKVYRYIENSIILKGNHANDSIKNKFIQLKYNNDYIPLKEIPIYNIDSTTPGLPISIKSSINSGLRDYGLGKIYRKRGKEYYNGNLNYYYDSSSFFPDENSTWIFEPKVQTDNMAESPNEGIFYIKKIEMPGLDPDPLYLNLESEIIEGYSIITLKIDAKNKNIPYFADNKTIESFEFIVEHLLYHPPYSQAYPWKRSGYGSFSGNPTEGWYEIKVRAYNAPDFRRLKEVLHYITDRSQPTYGEAWLEYKYNETLVRFDDKITSLSPNESLIYLDYTRINSNPLFYSSYSNELINPLIWNTLILPYNRQWMLDTGISIDIEESFKILTTFNFQQNYQSVTLIQVEDPYNILWNMDSFYHAKWSTFDLDEATKNIGVTHNQLKNLKGSKLSEWKAHTVGSKMAQGNQKPCFIISEISASGKIRFEDESIFTFKYVNPSDSLLTQWKEAVRDLNENTKGSLSYFEYALNNVPISFLQTPEETNEFFDLFRQNSNEYSFCFTLKYKCIANNSLLIADTPLDWNTFSLATQNILQIGTPILNTILGNDNRTFIIQSVDLSTGNLILEDLEGNIFIPEKNTSFILEFWNNGLYKLQSVDDFKPDSKPRILAISKYYGKEALGIIQGMDGVLFDIGENKNIHQGHTYPVKNLFLWKHQLKEFIHSKDETERYIFDNLRRFYESYSINPYSGESGWYPKLPQYQTNLPDKLSYSKALGGYFDISNTVIENSHFEIPLHTTVLFCLDNCEIVGIKYIKWKCMTENGEILVEYENDRFMWNFHKEGIYHLEVYITDLNDNTKFKKFENYITVI